MWAIVSKYAVINTCALVILNLSYVGVACAAQTSSTVVNLDYTMAVSLNNTDVELSRFSISSQTRLRLTPYWRAHFYARAEVADDEVGLGTISGYSSLSQPLIDHDSTRVEIDRAFI